MIKYCPFSEIPIEMILNQNLSNHRFAWYGFYEQQELVGVIAIQSHRLTFVRNLYVLPHHRNQGIGKQLVNHVLSIYNPLYLDCKENLFVFYSKLGFKFLNYRKIKSIKYLRMGYIHE